MWVGSEYTTTSFEQEAFEMGVSKRISVIPKDLEIGKSWIYLGKQGLIKERVGYDAKKGRVKKVDGVFYAFKVTAIEHWLGESDATEEKVQELLNKGITVVEVPETEVNQDHFGRAVKKRTKKVETRIPLDTFTSVEKIQDLKDKGVIPEPVLKPIITDLIETSIPSIITIPPGIMKWAAFLKVLREEGLSLSWDEKSKLWREYKRQNREALRVSKTREGD